MLGMVASHMGGIMPDNLDKELADFLKDFVNFAASDERSASNPDYRKLKERAIDLQERLTNRSPSAGEGTP
jgi:hypothetical protein